MDKVQFDMLNKKLDAMIGLLATMNLDDINKKIAILKECDISSNDIGKLLGIANVRQMQGWKG